MILLYKVTLVNLSEFAVHLLNFSWSNLSHFQIQFYSSLLNALKFHYRMNYRNLLAPKNRTCRSTGTHTRQSRLDYIDQSLQWHPLAMKSLPLPRSLFAEHSFHSAVDTVYSATAIYTRHAVANGTSMILWWLWQVSHSPLGPSVFCCPSTWILRKHSLFPAQAKLLLAALLPSSSRRITSWRVNYSYHHEYSMPYSR